MQTNKSLIMNLRVYKDAEGKFTGEADWIQTLSPQEYPQLKDLMKSFHLPNERPSYVLEEEEDDVWEKPKTELVKTDGENTAFFLKQYLDYNVKLEHIINRQSTMLKELLSMAIEDGKIIRPKRPPYWGRYGVFDD